MSFHCVPYPRQQGHPYLSLSLTSDAYRFLHTPAQVLEDLLASLTKLRRLTLMDCEFVEAPAAIFSLPDLEYLNFEDCSKLASLDAGTGLTRLTELCLIACRLEELPCLTGATRLEELIIECVEPIEGLRYDDFADLLYSLPSLKDKDPLHYVYIRDFGDSFP